jgi:hypothetical protein
MRHVTREPDVVLLLLQGAPQVQAAAVRQAAQQCPLRFSRVASHTRTLWGTAVAHQAPAHAATVQNVILREEGREGGA